MRFILFLLLLFCFINIEYLQAQDPPMKFGKVSPTELLMKTYEADTTASAVVLCDYGTASVEPGGNAYIMRWTQHKRIKILKKEGFDYANIAIPFYAYNDREQFGFQEAMIHLPNGQQISLTRKDVHVEQVSKYYSLAKFTFPQVTEGCIIEYSYVINSKYIYELREWFFQSEIPHLKSEIRVDFPQFVDYVYLFQGNEGMTATKDKDGNTIYAGKNGTFFVAPKRFVMEKAPAMKAEAYITTMDDYRARIRFQLSDIARSTGYIEKVMGDWPKLQKDIETYAQFGDQMLKKANYKKITEKLLPLAAEKANAKEKAAFFYDYLTTNIRWSESYSLFTREKKLNDIFEQGEANSAELNMMLYVLLTESGVKANPVILSTRDHGKMYENYPILDQFNHLLVVADIEGKPTFMDATERLRPIGYPSIAALNGRGLKLDFAAGRPTWINIAPQKNGLDAYTFNLRLDTEGNLAGTLLCTHRGYNAIPERRNAGDDQGKSLWQKRLAKRYAEAIVSSAKCGGLKELEQTYYDTLEISLPSAAQLSGDLLYLTPVIYSQFDENIFKLQERLYPVDVPYPFIEQVTMNLTLPEGYELESMPPMTTASVPAGGGSYFFATTKKSSNEVQFSASLNISKQIFSPEEYPALKALFDTMIKKRDEMVVIKKKA